MGAFIETERRFGVELELELELIQARAGAVGMRYKNHCCGQKWAKMLESRTQIRLGFLSGCLVRPMGLSALDRS